MNLSIQDTVHMITHELNQSKAEVIVDLTPKTLG